MKYPGFYISCNEPIVVEGWRLCVDGILVGNPNRKYHMGKLNWDEGGTGKLGIFV
jgi:hypothetical protein